MRSATAATAPATAPRTAVVAVFSLDCGFDAAFLRAERVAAARAAILRRAVFLTGTRFLVLAALRDDAVAFLAALFLPAVLRPVDFFFATNPPAGVPAAPRVASYAS